MNMFAKATKSASRIKMAIVGPAGAGKTYSALAVASGLGQRVAVVDSEHGSASKYADLFDFDVVDLDQHHPQIYIDMIKGAEEGGYDVLVIDSLSHAWNGVGGALELVDAAAVKSRSGNSFTAWKDVTPIQRRLVDAILASKMHIVCTMRAKTEYVIENVNGRNTPRKVGIGPVQRDGVEYEFDIVGEIDQSHVMTITKTRIPALDNFHEIPGRNVVEILKKWMASSPSETQEQKKQKAPAPTPDQNAQAAKKATEINALKKQISDMLLEMAVTPDEMKTVAPWLIKEFFDGDYFAARDGIREWHDKKLVWSSESQTFVQRNASLPA